MTGFFYDRLDAVVFFAALIYPVTTVPGSDLIAKLALLTPGNYLSFIRIEPRMVLKVRL